MPIGGLWDMRAIRCLCFPTAAADYLEYERFYMVDAIKDLIENGANPGVLDKLRQQAQPLEPGNPPGMEGRDADPRTTTM